MLIIDVGFSATSIRAVISVEEHLDRVLAETRLLGYESVTLDQARGRCLAETVVSTVPVPPWTNSAMDGYAVRAADLEGASADSPVSLKVVADIPAGSGEDPEIGPAEAARIMTGAPLPSSADTVIPQELTDGGLQTVAISEALPRGRHVRLSGEDHEAGSVVATAGTELTPEVLTSIASAGIGRIMVSVRPRVAVISTGDELMPPGAGLARGQIPDSNGLLVSFLAGDAGAVAVTDYAADSPDELQAAIDRHRSEADVLVITGGVSVGAYDPVRALFEGGSPVRFDRVAMQPGKPQAFGRLGEGTSGETGPLVFGLPGNPVSAWVSFQMFVRPALRKLQGFSTLVPSPVPARAGADWKTPKNRMQVIPARIYDDENREVLPAAEGGSGSHLIASLAGADGYALVDSDVESIRAGDRVLSVRLRDPEQFNHQQRSKS